MTKNLRSTLATTASILLLLAPAVVHSFNIHDFLEKDNINLDDTIQHLRGSSFGNGFDTSCVSATDEQICTTTKDGDSQHCVWCGVGGTYGACVSSNQATTFGKWMKCGGGGDKPDDKKENDIWGCIMSTDDTDCSTKKNCTWCTDTENQSGYGMCFTADIAAMATDKFGQLVKCGTEEKEDKKPSSVSFAAHLMDDNKDKDDDDKSGIFDCLTAMDDSDCVTKKCSWCTDAKDETGYGVCLTDDAATMAMEKIGQFVKCDTTVKGRNNNGGADKIKDTIKAKFEARKERARAHFKQWTSKAKENAWYQSFDNFDTTCLTSKSAETCTSTKDGNGEDCVWCDAMGTFGLCLSKDESAMAGNWMKCGSGNNDEKMQDDDDDKKGGGILDCVQAKDTSDCETKKKCTWCTDAKDETGMGMCLTNDIASKATEMFGQYVKCETKTEKKKPDNESEEEKEDVQAPQFDLQCMEQGGQDKTTCESTKDSEKNQPCKWCKAYHVLNVCVSAEEASEGSSFLECDTTSAEETEEEEEEEEEDVQEEDDLKFDLQCIKEQDKASCESTTDSEKNEPCKWCKAFKVENVCVSADEASEGSSFLECDDNSVMTEE